MKILTVISMLVLAGEVVAQQARVVSDRVNIRARPLDGAEVVGQVNQGDCLMVLKAEGDWAEVQAPTNVGVWVKAEFVKGGMIKADKVNVRSGPGVSYRNVGSLRSGTVVQVREERGEWTSIVPPDGISLWVKKEFLKMPDAGSESNAVPLVEMAVTGGVFEAESVVVPLSGTNLTRELPAGLKEEQLAAVLGQGAVLERQGVVERVPLAIFRGVEYRLVDEADGRRVTTCYLRGKDAEILGAMGKRVKVKGRAWWLAGERYPLLYPDEVVGE